MLELLYYNLTELEFRHRFLYTLLIRCIRAILESVFICHLAIPVIIYFISHIILIQIPQLRKEGKNTDELMAQMKVLSDKIKEFGGEDP